MGVSSPRMDRIMEVSDAVRIAKDFVQHVFADEQVTNIGLEETEYDPTAGRWLITVGFSRPWNTPRTRAQEVLENLGAVSSLRRTYKVFRISDDGQVISMKNPGHAAGRGITPDKIRGTMTAAWPACPNPTASP